MRSISCRLRRPSSGRWNRKIDSADRSKAWFAWMLEGTVPVAGTCDAPTDKVLALSQRLNVRGTPAIFFSNGERVPGFVPAAKLEEKLKQIASAK